MITTFFQNQEKVFWLCGLFLSIIYFVDGLKILYRNQSILLLHQKILILIVQIINGKTSGEKLRIKFLQLSN